MTWHLYFVEKEVDCCTETTDESRQNWNEKYFIFFPEEMISKLVLSFKSLIAYKLNKVFFSALSYFVHPFN